MALKILGTGQPRTGTTSLKTALEILGFGPCYHMFVLMEERPQDLHYFESALRGEKVDWHKLFSGYESAVDFPAGLYYTELLAAYPELRFIHTVREPDAWYKSMSDTILKAVHPPVSKILATIIRLPFSSHLRNKMGVIRHNVRMLKKVYGSDLKDAAQIQEKYRDFDATVLQALPKERVLVFKISEGWKPLCEFLEVPVPNTPFPHANSTVEFNKRVN